MLPLSIYIHWPFCKSKCPYCDFNSHVREGVDHLRWRTALLRELSYYTEKLQGREVASIFFGGGTPSLMEAQTVAALIDEVARMWKISNTVEITLEANPTSVEAARFKAFRSAGVNRVSLGVQSLNAKDLAFLGRQHSADEALNAVALAHELFPRMSFDLIYALPHQTPATWEKELIHALTFAKDHLSLYQLTIEENTAFHHAYYNGKFVLPEEGLAADMYDLTQSIMEAHGLPAYEISNHARVGDESRHNLAYWKSDDYIGIGPGAHGRYTLDGKRYATETIKSPERWLEKVEESGTSLNVETIISERERLEEAVMMGLRLRSGIDYKNWQERLGFSLLPILCRESIKRLSQQLLIVADESGIAPTKQGRLLLNRVAAELLTD